MLKCAWRASLYMDSRIWRIIGESGWEESFAGCLLKRNKETSFALTEEQYHTSYNIIDFHTPSCGTGGSQSLRNSPAAKAHSALGMGLWLKRIPKSPASKRENEQKDGPYGPTVLFEPNPFIYDWDDFSCRCRERLRQIPGSKTFSHNRLLVSITRRCKGLAVLGVAQKYFNCWWPCETMPTPPPDWQTVEEICPNGCAYLPDLQSDGNSVLTWISSRGFEYDVCLFMAAIWKSCKDGWVVLSLNFHFLSLRKVSGVAFVQVCSDILSSRILRHLRILKAMTETGMHFFVFNE